MDPYMYATYNYKYNQYLHNGCSSEVAAAEALRSVKSYYGNKANTKEFLNFANNVSKNLSTGNQVSFPQANVPGMNYHYNPQYGMVPSVPQPMYYGSAGVVNPASYYPQNTAGQTAATTTTSSLLSGISIKPPAYPNPYVSSVPIHPSQIRHQAMKAKKKQSPKNDMGGLGLKFSPEVNKAVTDWVYKIFSVHLTDGSMPTWRATVTNFVKLKIEYWKENNITPGKIDLSIPSAEVIQSFIAKRTAPKDAPPAPPVVPPAPIQAPPKVIEKPVSKSVNVKNKNKAKTKKKTDAADLCFEIDTTGTKHKDILKTRAERFAKDFKPAPALAPTPTISTSVFVGTSQEIEKQYLRLTGPPVASLVRPIDVLKKSFVHILEKYKETLNYRYIQEQFRSIRQDMKVQHINDLFATHIYETNARISLLNCDLDQFNQCQTQLIHLQSINNVSPENRIEFKFYRLLYLSLQNTKMDLLKYLQELNVANDDAVLRYPNIMEYAHKMRRIIQDENYYRYFKLMDFEGEDIRDDFNRAYQLATHKTKVVVPDKITDSDLFFSKYLFKMFNNKFRVLYLLTMTKSSISINPKSVYQQFKYRTVDEFKAFLSDLNIVWTNTGNIDSKQSLPILLESKYLKSKKCEP